MYHVVIVLVRKKGNEVLGRIPTLPLPHPFESVAEGDVYELHASEVNRYR